MDGDIQVVVSDSVLRLTIDRAAKRNALTERMYAKLAEQLEAANGDTQIRAILISGRGEHFCAGNDLAEAAAFGRGELTGESQSWRMIRALIDSELPIVAAVQGHAVGIGATMLLHCDVVFVATGTKIQTPFVKLGVVPEAVSSIYLPALVGHIRAFSMLGLGRSIDAATAVDWGMANLETSPDQVFASALEAATQLASASPEAVRHCKRLLRAPKTAHERAAEECELSTKLLSSPYVQSAFRKFLEKADGRS